MPTSAAAAELTNFSIRTSNQPPKHIFNLNLHTQVSLPSAQYFFAGSDQLGCILVSAVYI